MTCVGRHANEISPRNIFRLNVNQILLACAFSAAAFASAMNYIFSREVQAVSVCAIVDTMDTWITHEQQGHRRLVSSWDQSRRLRHPRIRPPHQREGASQTTCTGQFFKLFLCAVDDIETKEGRR